MGQKAAGEMKPTTLALLSDIHGNLTALEAVLADLGEIGVTNMVCLGDVAAYGPQPVAVLERLQALNMPVVMGNTDAWLLDPQPHPERDEQTGIVNDIELWGAAQITAVHRQYLQTFQPTITIPLAEDVELLCFHGSPRSFHDVILATTPDDELAGFLGGHTATIMAGGHTHTQLVRRFHQSWLLNPGSVGMPYESVSTTTIQRPHGAEYGLVSWVDGRITIQLRRVPYDTGRVAHITRASGMPHPDRWLANWGQ
jgi:predicted phosphodiesterase